MPPVAGTPGTGGAHGEQTDRETRREPSQGGRQNEKEHTEGDVVADMAQGTKVEARTLDGLPPVEEADGDGHGVTRREADDADAGEGVEGGSRAEVDEAEDDLDDHGQHHGVEGHAQLAVHRLPQLGPGDGAVPGERPDAAGRGGCAADAAVESEHDQGDEQAKGAARGADGGLDDGRDGLARGEGDEVVDVGDDKHQGDEGQQAGKGVEHDSRDHGLGDLGGGRSHLLAHAVSGGLSVSDEFSSSLPGALLKKDSNVRDDHARRRGGIRGLQEADTEGPAGDPSGARLEGGEDVLGRVAAVLCDGEDADDDGDEAGKGPEDGGGVEPRQPPVAQGRDGVAQQRDGQEDEEDLVRLAGEDALAGRVLEDADAGDQELGGAEVDGQRDGHVAHHVQPAADPAGHAPPPRRRQHKRLVVDAARRRVDAGDLAQRRRHAQDDARHGQPAPDDIGRPAARQRVVHGRRQPVGDRRQHKRHEGHLQRRPVARHLGRVSERFEELVGRRQVAAAAVRVEAALGRHAHLGLVVAAVVAGAMVLGHDTSHDGWIGVFVVRCREGEGEGQ